MIKISGIIGFGILFLLIALCIGSTFLFQNHEKHYTELVVSVSPGNAASSVQQIAQNYGFSFKEHAFAFKKANAFSRKHRIFKVSKYNIQPEELNSVLARLRELETSNIVEAIEPNYRMKISSNDPLFNKQWNLKQFAMEDVWKKGTGKGIVVAVIDTGISKKLGDLSPSRFTAGYNFISDSTDYEDDNGHGSHVAGTIGQDTNNGRGVAGIACDCTFMPLKVLNRSGYGSTVDIAEALVYAVDHGANIINMSLGGGGYSEVMYDACQYAWDNNVIVVASAGNESSNASGYPGRYETVISVAASGTEYELARYSNYGTGVDVIAPGGNMVRGKGAGILQNGPDFLSEHHKEFEKDGNDYFYYFQGTSMAAPHVAGVCAILYQSGIKNPAEMRDLLIKSSDRAISDLPFINPLNAVNKKTPSLPGKPKSPLTPGKPYFNTGPITTSTLTSVFTILIALFMFIAFDRTRKKFNTIDNIHTPQTYLGLILGANGISLIGYFLQNIFPFTILPERFTGLLFNSILDYDRVLFFLSKPSILWHNILIPVIFTIILNFKDDVKRCFSVGLICGFAAKLIADGIFLREISLLPDGIPAMIFLILNGLIAFTLPYVLVKK
jgi:serine protease